MENYSIKNHLKRNESIRNLLIFTNNYLDTQNEVFKKRLWMLINWEDSETLPD